MSETLKKSDMFMKLSPIFSVSPVEFVRKPSDKLATEGQTLALECSAVGEPTPSIDWTKNGHASLPSNPRYSILRSGSLVIANIRFEDRGIYACTARNRLQSISASAGVMVYGKIEDDTRHATTSSGFFAIFFLIFHTNIHVANLRNRSEIVSF